jgi:proteasome lid subunit RPN8/RPN11
VRPNWLTIQTHVIRQMREYCLSQYPLDGYGFLAGQGSVITHFFPISSENTCPCALEFEPRAYLETIKQIRELKLEWLGVVHSHPHSDAYPSARDLAGWHFENKSFWILSLKNPDIQLCAFYILKKRVIPIFYEIVD